MMSKKAIIFTALAFFLQLMLHQCGADAAPERCSDDRCAGCATKQPPLPENHPLADIIEHNNNKSDGKSNKVEESRWYLCAAPQAKAACKGRLGVKHMFIALFGTLLLAGLYRHFKNVRRYPPGPVPWPFFGNLLQV